MASQFASGQFDLAYPDGAEHHWWHLARNRIVLRAYERLGAAEGELLDIGCGRGIVVRYFRERGIACNGIELGPATPLRGAEPFVRVEMNALELPMAERERVAVVLLLDVIEHLSDPTAFLRDITIAFPNLTGVIVTVPARNELWSNHDEFYGHYRRYTLSQMAELERALGARCTWRGYFFRPLYPVLWVTARLKVKRNAALTAPGPSVRWLHKLLAAVFVLESRLLSRRFFGTSIVATFTIDRGTVPA
ncbi:MAG TPA: methyltransferase domain-containing protein [Thermoanaerobaculia bacterium]|nr:methyltransferase domain-containing protein [Thermoanaerobaculia bacterium]